MKKNSFVCLRLFAIGTYTLIALFLVANVPLFADDTPLTIMEPPAPGKQIVQQVELPANRNHWDIKKQGIEGINRAISLDPDNKEMVRYWLYLPLDYDKNEKKVPLFLFLHGAGERGDRLEDTTKVKVHGPPKMLDDSTFQKNWPCLTISPQCKANHTWSAQQLMLLLDHVEANYRIDSTRMYISGISMGGYGTWSCLNENPQRFAAAVPICGGADPKWATKFKDIPIWNFHGDKDWAVPISRSLGIVQALRQAEASELIFTVYLGAGHDVWTETYNNRLLYDWIFSKRK